MITFPAPATSNVACEFLALRSPVCFGPQLMGPIRPGRLSADQELLRTPPFPTETLAIAGHPGQSPAQFSLRRGAYLLFLVLQITGRFYHDALASHTVRRVTNSRAPWLRGHYPASQLLRTRPTPSRLRPLSRCPRLYGLPCSADFATGRGGSLQLLSASLSPCRR